MSRLLVATGIPTDPDFASLLPSLLTNNRYNSTTSGTLWTPLVLFSNLEGRGGGGGGGGPGGAQAAVGDRAGRLQRHAPRRDRPLMDGRLLPLLLYGTNWLMAHSASG